jgi:hypothetical protein
MRQWTVTLGLLVLLVSACGASSEDPAGSSTPTASTTAPQTATPSAGATEEAALREAVQTYSDAFLTGEADASYALLSKRCQARINKDEWSAELAQAKAQFGSKQPFTSYKATVSGDLARVSYTFSVASINQDSEPWVRENGIWHEDDC